MLRYNAEKKALNLFEIVFHQNLFDALIGKLDFFIDF